MMEEDKDELIAWLKTMCEERGDEIEKLEEELAFYRVANGPLGDDMRAETGEIIRQRDYYHDAWREACKERDYWREEAKRAFDANAPKFQSGER